LNKSGLTTITTATQAAEALRPLAGQFTYLLFALGIIGTGLLAVPILAGSASYAVSEAVGWKEGLYLKFKQAHGFYGVMMIATIVGLVVNFTPITPFQMLYYAAVVNGFLAPPLMVLIMLLANSKKVMGTYTNSRTSNILGWSITGIMALCAVALLW
jgi:Mn2+/Fe2+ NRAMP family transporter